MQFQGFKPEALQRIAGTMGYSGDMSKFGDFLNQDPAAKKQMNMYNQQAVSMMRGGMVRQNYNTGGDVNVANSPRSLQDINKEMVEINKQLAGMYPSTAKDNLIKQVDDLRKEYTEAGKAMASDSSITTYDPGAAIGSSRYRDPGSNPALNISNITSMSSDPNQSEGAHNLAYDVNGDGIITMSGDMVPYLRQSKGMGAAGYEDYFSNIYGVPENTTEPESTTQGGEPVDNTTGGDTTGTGGDTTGTTDTSAYDYDANTTGGDTTGTGGDTTGTTGTGSGAAGIATGFLGGGPQIKKDTINRMLNPSMPEGGKVNVVGTQFQANQGVADSAGKVSEVDPRAAVTIGSAGTAEGQTKTEAGTYDASTTKEKIEDSLDKTIAEQGTVSENARVKAARGNLSDGALPAADTFDEGYLNEVMSGERKVSSDELAVAQGLDETAVKAKIAKANVPDNIKAAQTSVKEEEIPKAAKIAESEMAFAEAQTDSGLQEDAKAVAEKMKSFNVDEGTLADFKEGKIEAEDTVQGQLANLMAQFDDGTPAWAAGAMRAANAAMAARGMGGSSMAAAAIVQASMESALPIAVQDANAFRSMKLDNLGRQQQISLANAAAQQGVKLQNFTAAQQTALQNSQNAFALQSQNLSNKQAAVLATAQIKASLQGQNLSNQQQVNLAEAARYAEVNNINLNNRQQGLLQDNANNLSVNLANLNAEQQAYIANAQLAAALQGKQIDNRQQAAMQNAATFANANNLTFTAGEQAKLHNSELMKTIGLANLSSAQANTLQKAAQIASMDMANLNNRQQAAVTNAQSFLAMDMTNLSNRQQAEMFKAQSRVQSLFSDQAADNAAKQFNATSETQNNQFFADLAQNAAQFNTNQKNSMAQFNAGEINSVSKFNTEIANQRDQFNASNALIIAQSNAQWRREIATADTLAINRANEINAEAILDISNTAYANLWQEQSDLMEWAWTSSDNERDRQNAVTLSYLAADLTRSQAEYENDLAASNSMGDFVGNLMMTAAGNYFDFLS